MEESSKISLKLLYIALADELLAWYQYWTCFNSSQGKGRSDANPEFDQHAKEEMEHANLIMERIKQLGGVPFNNPCDWEKNGNPWKPVETRNVTEQLKMTIEAEETAIRFYSNAIKAVKEFDSTTHRLFRKLLADEQEHLYDLQQLLIEQDDENETPETDVVVIDK